MRINIPLEQLVKSQNRIFDVQASKEKTKDNVTAGNIEGKYSNL
jgi:hypothetical protein